MRTVDAVVVLSALCAAAFALAVFPSYSFRVGWIVRFHDTIDSAAGRSMTSALERLPPPKAADLDGDGVPELVSISHRDTLEIRDVSKHLTRIKNAVRVSVPLVGIKLRAPLAFEVGSFQAGGGGEKVIVVMTRGWTVMCYSAKLQLRWQVTIPHHFQSNIALQEAVISILPVNVYKGDEGLVVVGGRLEEHTEGHAVQHEHADGESGSSADAAETDVNAAATRYRFSYYGLDGKTGAIRWEYTPDMTENEGVGREHDYMPEGAAATETSLHDWRHYYHYILQAMPFRWDCIEDTRLRPAHFEKNKQWNRMSKISPSLVPSIERGIVGAGSATRAAIPNVVLAYTRFGIEVIHLYTGKKLTEVPLDTDSASTYADINGNGAIDRASVEDTIEIVDRSGIAHTESDFALVMEGLPPTVPLFNGSLSRGASLATVSRSHDSLLVSPLMLPRRIEMLGAKRRAFDSIFLIHSGDMSSYRFDGTLNWQIATPLDWQSDDSRPALTSMRLHSDDEREYILATAERQAMIIHPNGEVMAQTSFLFKIVAPPVLADLDNDGVTDIIVHCQDGFYGLYVTHRLATPLLVMALVLIVFMLAMFSTQHQSRVASIVRFFKRKIGAQD